MAGDWKFSVSGVNDVNRELREMPAKLRMVEHMWRIAYADGRLGDQERHVMWRLSDLLHVPQGAYINAKMRAQARADAK